MRDVATPPSAGEPESDGTDLTYAAEAHALHLLALQSAVEVETLAAEDTLETTRRFLHGGTPDPAPAATVASAAPFHTAPFHAPVPLPPSLPSLLQPVLAVAVAASGVAAATAHARRKRVAGVLARAAAATVVAGAVVTAAVHAGRALLQAPASDEVTMSLLPPIGEVASATPPAPVEAAATPAQATPLTTAALSPAPVPDRPVSEPAPPIPDLAATAASEPPPAEAAPRLPLIPPHDDFGPVRYGRYSQVSDAERTCLARAVYYEARGEGFEGQLAVAQVILNRVRSRKWPDTICGVVNQGAERGVKCQFSYVCFKTLSEPKGDAYDMAQLVADHAVAGQAYLRELEHATHYHTTAVAPIWRLGLVPLRTIGAHIFYRETAGVVEPSARPIETASVPRALTAVGDEPPAVLQSAPAVASTVVVAAVPAPAVASPADRPAVAEPAVVASAEPQPVAAAPAVPDATVATAVERLNQPIELGPRVVPDRRASERRVTAAKRLVARVKGKRRPRRR